MPSAQSNTLPGHSRVPLAPAARALCQDSGPAAWGGYPSSSYRALYQIGGRPGQQMTTSGYTSSTKELEVLSGSM